MSSYALPPADSPPMKTDPNPAPNTPAPVQRKAKRTRDEVDQTQVVPEGTVRNRVKRVRKD
jgi:hypothetical protein